MKNRKAIATDDAFNEDGDQSTTGNDYITIYN